MTGRLLPDRIELGPVVLAVGDFERSLDYYRRRIGLDLLDQSDGRAVLGVGVRPLLELEARPGAIRDGEVADLFHFALLVPSRAALGRQLAHLIANDTPLTGASDHFVSEAIYLRDPDGHGIELYSDRPREAWYVDGRFRIGTVALDVAAVLDAGRAAGGRWDGLDPGTVMGHVHLETCDLDLSRRFYAGTLGFDVMQEMPQASFLSVGGYHHHLAFNTWGRRTRPARTDAGVLALVRYEIRLPDRTALERLAAGLGAELRAGTLDVRDPTGIPIRFSVAN